jgi:prolyl-tRNA synthetase
VEIGPKDLAKGSLALVRRVTPEGEKRKAFVPEAQAIAELPARLETFQTELLEASRGRREESTVRGVRSVDELAEALDHGAGFVLTGWSGSAAVEAAIKERTKATLRVLVDEEFRSPTAPAKCVSGEGASIAEVAWARAY